MINIYRESTELIWQKAYKRLIGKLEKHEKSLIMLSGGSVVALYPLLTDYLRFQRPNVALAQVDERFQPLYMEDQNGKAIANTGLFDAFEKGKANYYLISQEGVLERAALDYNTMIKKLFEEYPFKIAILGIGADGHTAGLLPGYQKEWDKDRYVVGYELKIKNQKSKLNGENKKWFWKRITVTPKALRSLDYALVVAMGEGKREAVGKLKWEVARLPARQGDRKLDINHYPAGILGQMKEVDVYTDVDL